MIVIVRKNTREDRYTNIASFPVSTIITAMFGSGDWGRSKTEKPIQPQSYSWRSSLLSKAFLWLCLLKILWWTLKRDNVGWRGMPGNVRMRVAWAWKSRATFSREPYGLRTRREMVEIDVWCQEDTDCVRAARVWKSKDVCCRHP